MKKICILLFIISVFAESYSVFGDWWNPKPISNYQYQPRWYRNDPVMQNMIPEGPECVFHLIYPNASKGPTIQLDFVDEKGRRLSLRHVNFQILSHVDEPKSLRGIGNINLCGAQSIKTLFTVRDAKEPITDEALKFSSTLFSGTRYLASFGSWIIDGSAHNLVTIFTTPEFEVGKDEYRITVVRPSPPAGAVDMNAPKPSPFELEGVAPKLAPRKSILELKYRNGEKITHYLQVLYGAPFQLGVDTLGGDLFFSEFSDDRPVVGFSLSVDNPKIGVIEPIKGSRMYTLTRGYPKYITAEKIWFFDMTQSKSPLSVAIFEERSEQERVLLDPGKYRIYTGELPKNGNYSDLPFSEIEVGDELTVKWK